MDNHITRFLSLKFRLLKQRLQQKKSISICWACVMTCSIEDTLSRFPPLHIPIWQADAPPISCHAGAQELVSLNYGDLQLRNRLSNSCDAYVVRDQFKAVQHRQKEHSYWEMKANLYQLGRLIKSSFLMTRLKKKGEKGKGPCKVGTLNVVNHCIKKPRDPFCLSKI